MIKLITFQNNNNYIRIEKKIRQSRNKILKSKSFNLRNAKVHKN